MRFDFWRRRPFWIVLTILFTAAGLFFYVNNRLNMLLPESWRWLTDNEMVFALVLTFVCLVLGSIALSVDDGIRSEEERAERERKEKIERERRERARQRREATRQSARQAIRDKLYGWLGPGRRTAGSGAAAGMADGASDGAAGRTATGTADRTSGGAQTGQTAAAGEELSAGGVADLLARASTGVPLTRDQKERVEQLAGRVGAKLQGFAAKPEAASETAARTAAGTGSKIGADAGSGPDMASDAASGAAADAAQSGRAETGKSCASAAAPESRADGMGSRAGAEAEFGAAEPAAGHKASPKSDSAQQAEAVKDDLGSLLARAAEAWLKSERKAQAGDGGPCAETAAPVDPAAPAGEAGAVDQAGQVTPVPPAAPADAYAGKRPAGQAGEGACERQSARTSAQAAAQTSVRPAGRSAQGAAPKGAETVSAQAGPAAVSAFGPSAAAVPAEGHAAGESERRSEAGTPRERKTAANADSDAASDLGGRPGGALESVPESAQAGNGSADSGEGLASVLDRAAAAWLDFRRGGTGSAKDPEGGTLAQEPASKGPAPDSPKSASPASESPEPASPDPASPVNESPAEHMAAAPSAGGTGTAMGTGTGTAAAQEAGSETASSPAGTKAGGPNGKAAGDAPASGRELVGLLARGASAWLKKRSGGK